MLPWKPGLILVPDSEFSVKYYTRTYADVLKSGKTPRRHYDLIGRHEGRSPNGWFEAIWYHAEFLQSDQIDEKIPLAEAYRFFCERGNLLGHSPNPRVHTQIIRRARAAFDSGYYKRMNPDVVSANGEPWPHYQSHGWLEGRNPAPWFDSRWYMENQMPGRANPLIHFILIGKEKGVPTVPPAGRVGEASATPQTKTTGDELPAGGISHLLRHVAHTVAKRSPISPLSDASLLEGASLFNCEYYEKHSGVGGDRRELVRHYLAEGAKEGLWINPEFSEEFYRRHYSSLPERISDLGLRAGELPVVHYLRIGKQYGFYPNPQIAHLEIASIAASHRFDRDFYMGCLDRPLKFSSAVMDYAFYGHVEGRAPSDRFDARFVSELYRSICNMPMYEPVAFCLRNSARAWLFESPAALEIEAEAIAHSAFFSEEFYAEAAGIKGKQVSPSQHYATIGLMNMLPASPEFDTGLYLSRYPDVARARINPLLHYDRHGRGEGRSAAATLDRRTHDLRSFDPGRRTILLFSHESSRTGAPIVALNVARYLSETSNVVTVLGDASGPLIDEFASVSIDLLAGWGTPAGLEQELRSLHGRYRCSFAIVNSVVSSPVVGPLNRVGIPIVSLIHEFADYVYPPGTLSRMVLTSDIAVFPARIVQESFEEETFRLGAISKPGNVRIRHQGHNTPGVGEGAFTTEQLRGFLNVPARDDATSKPCRVLFGAGSVEPRKGVDLFLGAAQQLMRISEFDWRFVWVGRGFDPEADKTTSIFLAHQIKKTGLADRTFIVDEQPDLDSFWAVADVFFLSSRLDPFPNVALDALAKKIPVVCFEGGTGVADLATFYPRAVKAVPFGDVASAAAAINAFSSASTGECEPGGDFGDSLAEELSFATYIAQIQKFAEEASSSAMKVAALLDGFAQADRLDLVRVEQRLPASLLFEPVSSIRPDCSALARHMLSACFDLGAWFDTKNKVFQERWRCAEICDGRYGRVEQGQDLPNNHLLHLHVADADWGAVLSSSENWLLDLLSRARAVVTCPTLAVGRVLRHHLPAEVTIVDQAFSDVASALGFLLSDMNSALVGPDATFTHVNLFRASPRARLSNQFLDTLAWLNSSASLEYLGANPNVVAVVSDASRESAPTRVREFAKFHENHSEPRVPYATGFAGTYRSQELRDGLAAISTLLCSKTLGMLPEEKIGVAGFLFAQEIARQGRSIAIGLSLA